MKNLILILTIIFGLTSCEESHIKEVTENNEFEIKKEVNVSVLETGKLKKDTLMAKSGIDDIFAYKNLENKKNELIQSILLEKNEDKLLVDFLVFYSMAVDSCNEILFRRKDYEDLNTIIFNEEDILDTARMFEKLAHEYHYSIAQSEAMIYLEKETEFIQDSLFLILDSNSQFFIKTYINEIDLVCCHDASLVIDYNELFMRLVNWSKVYNLSIQYQQIALENLNSYLFIIFLGMDNSPAFNYENQIYKAELLKNVDSLIYKSKDSFLVDQLSEYKELLSQNDYLYNDNIKLYLSEKFDLKL